MDKLPSYREQRPPAKPRKTAFKALLAAILLAAGPLAYLAALTVDFWGTFPTPNVPINAANIVRQCKSLHLKPGPPSNFHERKESDRFEPGTLAVLIRNATIWTGRADGLEVVSGDLFLHGGIIKAVGDVEMAVAEFEGEAVVVDAAGAWVTPGIVDMHSHLGVDSVPELRGASDTNSFKGLAMPWLRSLDGLNTHDEAYRLSVSGGVTTANVLPGSADAIGGQAFPIKLRPTKERSTSSLLLEPPFSINGTDSDYSHPLRWRQMKHACGENPSRVYSGTRMDTQWAFRQAYETARKIKEQQDQYCERALSGRWTNLGPFPEDLQWEALVDVLRGRVKVHNHCYEAVDLDNMIRLTNEFKFSIAAFHHAHEAYLVPDLLKKAYGEPPAIALFATNARYKREAYRGSEFAPKILADNGLDVVMKSDHPVLDSRFLLNEAQQAHYYGLPKNIALASVTSTPATVLGYHHRIGFIKAGYDADIVVWDSHPLQLGATPKQVYIDGIPQIQNPHFVEKPEYFQHAPDTPDFGRELQRTLTYDGLPPIFPQRTAAEVVVFTNVSSIHVRDGPAVKELFDAKARWEDLATIVVKGGEILCINPQDSECASELHHPSTQQINLEGGSISPALISFGSRLGLNHIDGESSTNDGNVIDQLKANNPSLLGEGSIIRAVDGLQFSTRDALLAYRAGATVGVTAPSARGFLSGLSVAFDTGAPHKLFKGAVIQNITALHISIDSSQPSVSTQISALRGLLLGEGKGELANQFLSVTKGRIPLVIDVQSADIMATLIVLKEEVERRTRTTLKFTFVGANEAHLLAKEIGEAGIGVILSPARPFPSTWRSSRILPGPPLSQDNSAAILIRHNVTVGLGVVEQWQSRNLRFDVGWTALEAHGHISRSGAIALASANLEKLLGISTVNKDLVAVKRSSLHDFGGQVVGIISPRQGGVNLIL